MVLVTMSTLSVSIRTALYREVKFQYYLARNNRYSAILKAWLMGRILTFNT